MASHSCSGVNSDGTEERSARNEEDNTLLRIRNLRLAWAAPNKRGLAALQALLQGGVRKRTVRALESERRPLELHYLVTNLRELGYKVVPASARIDAATLTYRDRNDDAFPIWGILYASGNADAATQHYKAMLIERAPGGICVSVRMDSSLAAKAEKNKGLAVAVLAPGSAALANFCAWVGDAQQLVADLLVLQPNADTSARFDAGRMAFVCGAVDDLAESDDLVMQDAPWERTPSLTYSVPLDITVTRTAGGGYERRWRLAQVQ